MGFEIFFPDSHFDATMIIPILYIILTNQLFIIIWLIFHDAGFCFEIFVVFGIFFMLAVFYHELSIALYNIKYKIFKFQKKYKTNMSDVMDDDEL